MKCACNSHDNRCIDSRQFEEYRRRRYKCVCKERFTTYEISEERYKSLGRLVREIQTIKIKLRKIMKER